MSEVKRLLSYQATEGEAQLREEQLPTNQNEKSDSNRHLLKLAVLGNVVLALLLMASVFSGNHDPTEPAQDLRDSPMSGLAGGKTEVLEAYAVGGRGVVGWVEDDGEVYEAGRGMVGWVDDNGEIYALGRGMVGWVDDRDGLVYASGIVPKPAALVDDDGAVYVLSRGQVGWVRKNHASGFGFYHPDGSLVRFVQHGVDKRLGGAAALLLILHD